MKMMIMIKSARCLCNVIMTVKMIMMVMITSRENKDYFNKSMMTMLSGEDDNKLLIMKLITKLTIMTMKSMLYIGFHNDWVMAVTMRIISL